MTTTLTPGVGPQSADPWGTFGPAGSAGGGSGGRVVRTPRVSRGHVLMTVAGLAAAVLAFAALRTRPGDLRVAIAAHEIRAGERVAATDFRVASVSVDDVRLGPLVQAGDLSAIAGRIAGATIEAGELVPRRLLRPRAARGGRRAISIPIDPGRAVGGHLAVGDRVDVLLADEHSVAIIVPDAEVLAVDQRGVGGIGDSSSPFTVTIAVDEEESRAVAAAVVGDGLSLARTTGATPAASSDIAAIPRRSSTAVDGSPVSGTGGR